MDIRKRFRKIVAFEGIDGSGKTMQIDLLANKLKVRDYKVLVKSFPNYESFFGIELGTFLSGESEFSAEKIDPKSMALWYAVDRWNSFETFRHTGVKYDFLLLNRYTLSNAVYQSIRHKEQDQYNVVKWIFDLEHEIFKLPKPDVYIIFDIDPEKSKENVAQKGHRDYIGNDADVYERSSNLLHKARVRYIEFTKRLENTFLLNVLDATGTMRDKEDIGNEVIDIILKDE